jgi:lipid A 3-O-deacylase PagL
VPKTTVASEVEQQMRFGCVVLMAALAALATSRVQAADFCSSCEVELGLGTSFHYWGYNNSLVVPVALNFDHDRWELGAFRFTSNQRYYSDTFAYNVLWATPYWGFSLTRRLELVKLEHFRLFLGLGAAYKTQENRQIASLWNFSEQAGARFIPAPGYAIELTWRHWSNAGIKLPNHGQDFGTLMFSVYPGFFHHRDSSSSP